MVPHTRHNVGALLLSPPDFGHLLLSKKQNKKPQLHVLTLDSKKIQKYFQTFIQLTVIQILAIPVSLKYRVVLLEEVTINTRH